MRSVREAIRRRLPVEPLSAKIKAIDLMQGSKMHTHCFSTLMSLDLVCQQKQQKGASIHLTTRFQI